MIDVVFLLLIFFVCTASFELAEEILPTQLALSGSNTPEQDVDPQQDLEQIIIKLRRHDRALRWVVAGRTYDDIAQLRRVLEAVAAIDRGVPVILDVEDAVLLKHVVDLYDLCRMLGFTKIRFAASIEV